MLQTLCDDEKTKSALSFGTGGIRGLRGDAADEINVKTIHRVAAAMALRLKEKVEKSALRHGVLIAYDTRLDSKALAEATAAVFAAYGIPAMVFDAPTPVPVLSFTLKRENYLGGVMITASHNPKEYNGFKVYNENGGQLTPGEAAPIDALLKTIKDEDIPIFSDLSDFSEGGEGLIAVTGRAERAAYLTAVTNGFHASKPLTIVATPLHGAAKALLPAALRRCGHRVFTVAAQECCDGAFSTVAAPNPEDPAVFDLAKELGAAVGADLLLATDGDGDRCGCCVRGSNGYRQLSANDTAALLIDFLIKTNAQKIPDDAYIVTSAVSGTLAQRVADAKGIPARLTPTGFKYVGEMLLNRESGSFFAGYEESGGFLAGNHAADKDGIFTAVLLAAAAAYHRRHGDTLHTALGTLFEGYGYEYTETESFLFPGRDGMTRREACLSYFTTEKLPWPVYRLEADPETLFFDLALDVKTALRPSGTEPKLKLYHTVFADGEREARGKLMAAKDPFIAIIQGFSPQTK